MLAAALVVVALLLGFIVGRRALVPLQRQLADQGRQLQAERQTLSGRDGQIHRLESQLAQLRTTCDDARQAQSEVSAFLSKGQLPLAAGLAELKLAQQGTPLCAAAKAALAGFWYRASIDDVFSTPRPDWPGTQVDQQLVARWVDIEHKADTVYPVPKDQRWAPMSIAVRAYNAELWALSDAAFRKAWSSGAMGDQAILFRYDLLRNWGYNLAHKGGPTEKAAAVRMLATARAIADHYHLPRPEARQDLQDLGYQDCHSAQPDPLEPTLMAGARQ